MKTKRALITGITGQDGSYLAEMLLKKGYSIIGVTSGKSDRHNVASIKRNIKWVVGDMTDPHFVERLVKKYRPREIYNLASVATVAEPWDAVYETIKTTALVPLYLLEAIRKIDTRIRFFQASSAQMFGRISGRVNERTPFDPRNPYSAGKIFAHTMVEQYREDHGVFAASGILFNHESPRRGEEFVTRKIVLSLAKIKLGQRGALEVGNLDARRDWGYAGDFVRAMWLMLQQKRPDDYVIGTGKTHSVRDFIAEAAHSLGMNMYWSGSGMREVGKDGMGVVRVRVSTKYYRTEGAAPYADITKAKRVLGWKPRVSFRALVKLMAHSDLDRIRKAK